MMYGEKQEPSIVYIDRFGILEQITTLAIVKRYFYNEEFDPGSG